MLCDECERNPTLGGMAITKFICPQCYKEKMSGSTNIPKLCVVCSDRDLRCARCLKDLCD